MADFENAEIEEEKEAEIELSKVYRFPEDVVIRKYGSAYLAIYTKGISWLVLESDKELRVFQLLRGGHSIEEVLNSADEDDVIKVIRQIEAKNFEHPITNERTDRNIYIYLTNNCNERCRHCYMFAGDVKFTELTPEQWMGVIDDFSENGGTGITFTGGEVTVYRGFDRVIRHAHEAGVKVTVLSNGIQWKKELICDLSPCIDEIQISIDGYDAESYYKVRRFDGFARAIQCVEDFCECGTKVSVAATPLYDDLPDFVAKFEPFARSLMKKHPEVHIKLNLELIPGREVHATPEENRQYRQMLRDLVERLYHDYYIKSYVLNYENHILKRNCGFGEISLAADGRVFWCSRIHELKSSMNVLETGFRELFAKSDEIRESTSVDNTAGCRDCDVRYICGGGCRIKYQGIKDAETHAGEWEYACEGKDRIYDRMIRSNRYFFE